MTGETTARQPLRLWPGWVIVALQWLAKLVLPLFGSVANAIGAMSGLLLGLFFVVWWVFFSRAPRLERWGGVALIAFALIGTRLLVDRSIATAGMGMSYYIVTTPIACLAIMIWAVAARRLPDGPRRLALLATILVAYGGWTLLRLDGITSNGATDYAWRWAQTHEQRLLSQTGDEPTPHALPASTETSVEWPGFRGPDRNGIARGTRIETDWAAAPPEELWRRPIGPGWSSFAIHGDRFYTQEQRGEEEVVSCHVVSTGELVWRHGDAVRFWDSHAGAGPRATPALANGHVYSFGATGVLNALDAENGTLAWSRDVATDTEREIPGWGFTSSPLIVDNLVVVHTGRLAAYDLDSGEPRWLGPRRGGSYSSPHLATIDDVEQVVMISGAGATGVSITDGAVLWELPWGGSIVQPAQTADGDVLIAGAGLAGGAGLRRVSVRHGSDGWDMEERWTSLGLKPNMSDFVIHEGHAYGFDDQGIACIDLDDGERRWKGGRYGSGQLVLLPDQDLLLVVSERGELALLEATPERFKELSRHPAIKGKTWTHPVRVGDTVLVRNAEEMAAFRLPEPR